MLVLPRTSKHLPSVCFTSFKVLWCLEARISNGWKSERLLITSLLIALSVLTRRDLLLPCWKNVNGICWVLEAGVPIRLLRMFKYSWRIALLSKPVKNCLMMPHCQPYWKGWNLAINKCKWTDKVNAACDAFDQIYIYIFLNWKI